MEKSEIAIREAVEQAERIAGTNIDQVFVGFSAGGLVSNVASVEVEIGGTAHRARRHRRTCWPRAGTRSIPTGG